VVRRFNSVMDIEDPIEPQCRTRTSSFRSTQSGSIHPSSSVRSPRSSSSEEGLGSPCYTSCGSSAIRQHDDQALSQWKDLISSLDTEKQADLYSKLTIKSRTGNLRHQFCQSIGPSLCRAPAVSSNCVAIAHSTSMGLLYTHLKEDNAHKMAVFLKEKTCISDESVSEEAARAGPSRGRGVKRSADAIDAPSPSDTEDDVNMANEGLIIFPAPQ
jgi:hypothetical protein